MWDRTPTVPARRKGLGTVARRYRDVCGRHAGLESTSAAGDARYGEPPAMTVLTTNERAFIDKMKESEELARHGFSLILKRPDFLRFFQPLWDAGLFAPERNP